MDNGRLQDGRRTKKTARQQDEPRKTRTEDRTAGGERGLCKNTRRERLMKVHNSTGDIELCKITRQDETRRGGGYRKITRRENEEDLSNKTREVKDL